MRIEQCKIVSISEIQSGIFLLSVDSEYFAENVRPGQFFNIKVSDNFFPLLRRPFSVSDRDKGIISFMFDIHGEGTRLLSEKKPGNHLDILGPLGNGFNYESGYDTAIFVSGGLGFAPFPFLYREIKGKKEIFNFVGAQNSKRLIKYNYANTIVATDDGSEGYKGNVIDLFKIKIGEIPGVKRIFACGPTPMLKALTDWVNLVGLDTQISLECAMACGFGICQGCPVEVTDKSGYKLVCKDGPVFNAQDIIVS